MVLPDDYMEALCWLPEAERDDAVLQTVAFVMSGFTVEPKLPGHLMAVFAAARRSIVKANRLAGNGRAGGKASDPGTATDPGAGESGSHGAEKAWQANSENACQANSENACQANSENACQANSENAPGEHNRTEQNGTEQNERGARTRGEVDEPAGDAPAGRQPPTLEEARSYFGCNMLNGSAEDWWLNRQRSGWLDPQGRQIVDWTADALAWSRREVQIRHDRDERSRARQRGDPGEARGPRFEPAKSAAEKLAEFEREHGAKAVA